MKYGEQIGIIVYGKDGNRGRFAGWHVRNERAKGNIIVFCDGYARIHKP